MTTDELLNALPSHIGRNRIYDDDGRTVLGYFPDRKPGGDIGWLYLNNDGKDWIASYGTSGCYVCMNPDATKPPYNNAFFVGKTPQEALQGLYDWCVDNGFIKTTN